MQLVSETNVEVVLDAIREHSPVFQEMSAAGEVRLVGAMYDVQTGTVTFSG